MKKEFTPGHFFMNRSLIWRREGEVGGVRGASPFTAGSRCPGGITAGADASGHGAVALESLLAWRPGGLDCPTGGPPALPH